MRSEAQKRADARRAEKLVSFTVHINRELEPEAARILEAEKTDNQRFKSDFIQWLLNR